MAKLQCTLRGSFDTILQTLETAVLNGSFSASFEDGSDFRLASGARCAVRVYERYSWTGGNRVSLNITLLGQDGVCSLSAITSGGSQALLFKINTFGEEAFLDTIRDAVSRFQ